MGEMIEVKQTNIGRMTFADRNTKLTVNVIAKQCRPLLEEMYEHVKIVSVNRVDRKLHLVADGQEIQFLYDIVTASRLTDPHGFRLLGKVT